MTETSPHPSPHPAVQRALDEGHVSHVIRYHRDFAQPIRSPQDFALALGYDIGRITKSLFVRGADAYALIVCSSVDKVDFKEAARLLTWKRVEVASRPELDARLGFPPNGVSPIGVDATFPILMDDSLSNYATILVGAGTAGVEVEIDPAQLAALVHASVRSVIKRPQG